MILDLEKFTLRRQKVWNELDEILKELEKDPAARMNLEKIKRFHNLYQRTAADLSSLQSFACAPELRQHLESLVARGVGEIQGSTRSVRLLSGLGAWRLGSIPAAFQRRLGAFRLAVAAMLLGVLFGGALLLLDSDTKRCVLPFGNLAGSPSKRVAKEEAGVNKSLERQKLVFSSQLMTNNIKVAILCLALGVTFGIGTLVLLFYNGVILGVVALDYLRAGQAAFLFGWLLPHGSIEIPAFLIAGQAGLVLGGAMLGMQSSSTLTERLRNVSSDIVTLVSGTALLLVWAGIVEAFFSQYHEPVIPYGLKIAFGIAELLALFVFLARTGQRGPRACVESQD
ncbi:MAG: stage II sporulation protein M [Syntrophobacteraceae bacterium]|nr:stage II sporulation protein M [Syntrophobacteraceae bacterium]